MTDINLFQTNDDGNISVVNGSLAMTDGPEVAVYLSLFGGNEDDPGGSDKSREWWGNAIDNAAGKEYRSRTQYLLRSLPQSSGNLNKLKQAAENDLAWTIPAGLFSSYTVYVSVPKINWVSLRIDTESGTLRYVVPWEVTP